MNDYKQLIADNCFSPSGALMVYPDWLTHKQLQEMVNDGNLTVKHGIYNDTTYYRTYEATPNENWKQISPDKPCAICERLFQEHTLTEIDDIGVICETCYE